LKHVVRTRIPPLSTERLRSGVDENGPPAQVSVLLAAHAQGDRAAFDRLVPLVYGDLRRMARAQLRRRQRMDSLDTAALVHDAYLRLADQTQVSWRDRGHFFAVCALAMRQIVVDRARRRRRIKRGGDQIVVPLDAEPEPHRRSVTASLDVDLALEKLAAQNPRLARVVECRYFAGLNDAETADALGVSVRTAQREWFKARAWLRIELGERRR
jgi:RNA polymerase sigma factor (TIGR02999 family)